VSEGIDFELPVWRAEVYHNTPGTDGVWHRVFNWFGTEDGITSEVKRLFEAEGLNSIRIFQIYVEQLHVLNEEGGDDAGS
jgi:hypothetical protein